MAFNSMQEENIASYGGGYGGFGSGAWAMILLVVVVLWVLFKDGHRDGYGGGYQAVNYGFGGMCVQPTYKDESNWEQESHLKDKLCLIDKDVIEQGCKDREAIHCDGDKTREYIAHLQERADDRAYNQLAMQLAQKDNFIQTLQLEKNIDSRIAGVIGAVERLACEVPKRPPFYACGGEPTVYDYPPRFNDFPRRGRCDGFGDQNCG